MTACGGERRFASSLAKKLQQLGAITKGDRRAADAADLTSFDVDTKYGSKALTELLELIQVPEGRWRLSLPSFDKLPPPLTLTLTPTPTQNADFSAQKPPPDYVRTALGIARNGELQNNWTDYLQRAEDGTTAAGIDPDNCTVKSFLNRMLGLTVELQNMIFSHFAAELDEQIKLAKSNDQFDEGVVDIRGEAISLAPGYPEVLATDTSTGVPLMYHKLNVDRGISHSRAIQILDAKAQENEGGERLRGEGFYRATRFYQGREKEGLKACVLLVQKPIRAFALNPGR